MKSKSKAVMITGASTGIGLRCALRLDTLGFRLFAGVRNEDDAEKLVRASSDRITPVMIDVTKPDQIATAAEEVRSALGGEGLHGLVNNAGIVVSGPLEFLAIEDIRRQFEVNVIGQIAVTQAFTGMLRRARGRIVNIGSISGVLATPFLGPYCASKFALEALSDSMRMELKPWGISVSLVQPGSVETPIWDKSAEAADRSVEAMPPQADTLYGLAIEAVREAVAKTRKGACSPDLVAKAVAEALTSERPRTRYVVGPGMRVQALFARFAPDRLRDTLIMREMGLGRR